MSQNRNRPRNVCFENLPCAVSNRGTDSPCFGRPSATNPAIRPTITQQRAPYPLERAPTMVPFPRRTRPPTEPQRHVPTQNQPRPQAQQRMQPQQRPPQQSQGWRPVSQPHAASHRGGDLCGCDQEVSRHRIPPQQQRVRQFSPSQGRLDQRPAHPYMMNAATNPKSQSFSPTERRFRELASRTPTTPIENTRSFQLPSPITPARMSAQPDDIMNAAFCDPCSGNQVASPMARRFQELAARTPTTPIGNTQSFQLPSPITPAGMRTQSGDLMNKAFHESCRGNQGASPMARRFQELAARTPTTPIANTQSFQLPSPITPAGMRTQSGDLMNKAFHESYPGNQGASPMARRFQELAARTPTTPIANTQSFQLPSPITPAGMRTQSGDLMNKAFYESCRGNQGASPMARRFQELAARTPTTPIGNTRSFQLPSPITPAGMSAQPDDIMNTAFCEPCSENQAPSTRAVQPSPAEMRLKFPQSSPPTRQTVDEHFMSLAQRSVSTPIHDTAFISYTSPDANPQQSYKTPSKSHQLPKSTRYRGDHTVNETVWYSLGDDTSCQRTLPPEATPPRSQQPPRRTPPSLEQNRWDNLVNQATNYSLNDISCDCVPSPEATPPRQQPPPRPTPPGLKNQRWDNLVGKAAGYSLRDTSCECLLSPEAIPSRSQQPQTRMTTPDVERQRWDNLAHEASGYSLRDTPCACVPSPEATPPRSQQPPRPMPPGLEQYRLDNLVDEAAGHQSFMNDDVDLDDCYCY